MNKTFTITNQNKPVTNWHFIDASGQVLGKLSTEVVKLLMGKHKPEFSLHINVGDKVVVTNVSKIVVTGKKATDKVYNWYTGYPGGLKSLTFEKMMLKDSREVIRSAVSGMLPKNKLRAVRMANLYVYKDGEHPHTSQANAQAQKLVEKKSVVTPAVKPAKAPVAKKTTKVEKASEKKE